MKCSLAALLLVLGALADSGAATNAVVNLSHYDLMRPDFAHMKSSGIVGIIHEASYPRLVRDAKYAERQNAAVGSGLLWGAYHFADASDPVRQADHFLDVVASSWRRAGPGARPSEVLLILDFEKNGHYPGGTMRVDQAVAFIARIRERTGKYPGFYGGEYRLRQMLSSSKITAAQSRALANCWLWVANYHYQPPGIEPFGRWDIWQYTGDGVCDLPRATFPKSIANVVKAERNIFRGSAAELRAFWQTHGWVPNE